MKKSLLGMALASGLLAMTLAGCNNTSNSSKASSTSSAPASTSSKAADVPTFPAVPAGKTAWVVKLTSESVSMPTFDSPFLTGPMAQTKDATTGKYPHDWPTGLSALEMKANVTGYEGYYVAFSNTVYDPADYLANGDTTDDMNKKNLQYQLVAGYNSSAETADSRKGLQWTDAYKSATSAALGGVNNPTFTAPGENRTVYLGEDKFTDVPATPAPALKNWSFKFSFATAIPTWQDVYCMGSFDGWDTKWANAANHKCVIAADRLSATYTIKEAYAQDNIAYALSFEYNSSKDTADEKYEATDYSWTKPWAADQKIDIKQIDGDDFTTDPITVPTENFLPDPTIKYAVTFELTNTNATALPETVKLYVAANFNGWNKGTDDANVMTFANGKYTYACNITAGTKQWGILSSKSNADWDPKLVGNAAGENFSVKVTGAGTVKMTGDLSILNEEAGSKKFGFGTVEFVKAA